MAIVKGEWCKEKGSQGRTLLRPWTSLSGVAINTSNRIELFLPKLLAVLVLLSSRRTRSLRLGEISTAESDELLRTVTHPEKKSTAPGEEVTAIGSGQGFVLLTLSVLPAGPSRDISARGWHGAATVSAGGE